jgi:teichuronic acid exporter
MSSLKKKTARGLIWSFADSFGVYLIKFGFSIAIARTLSPDDYGVMGLIVIFISLGQIFAQGGFPMALINKKDAGTSDFSTVFWFNVVIGVIIYLVLYVTAPLIADFYDETIIVNVIRVVALSIVLSSFSGVQLTLLSKAMNFRRQAYINLLSALLSGTCGITLALRGYEVWALVFQSLTGSLVSSLGLWIFSSWKPKFLFSFRSFKSLFSYGYKVFLQGLGDVLFTKIYFPLIGKYFPVAQLGYYTNASRFNDIFIRQTSNAFTRVIFPAFSTIQDEKERFNNSYLSSFRMLSAFMYLVSLMLIILSRSFVTIALTDKWLPAVPLMVIFFCEGFFFPLFVFNQNILLSVGRSGLSLKIDILKKAATLASILIAFKFGIKALIIGQVTATVITFSISMLSIVKVQGVSAKSIINPLIKIMLITAACLLINFFLIVPEISSMWLEVMMQCTAIPLLFLLLLHLSGVNVIQEAGLFIKRADFFSR